MAYSAQSDLLLTFEQSTVYVSDYNTLGAGKWLNDTIIGFGYDILAHKVFKDAAKSSLLFVHPTTVNVIKFENDEEDLIPLIVDAGIQSHDFIFFPINNSQSMFSVGGSHWALLIYQRHNNAFYYLDSAGVYNLTYAQKFANKIYPYIQPKKQSNDSDENEAKEANIDYVNVLKNFTKIQVPQQQNGYDCGLYVVEFSQFVAQFYVDNMGKDDKKKYPCVSDLQFSNQEIKFDGKYMVEMRQKWQQIINDMAKK